MKADTCLKNVRCDCGGCKNFAITTLDTHGYKGSICLCKDCFLNLYKDLTKIKRTYELNNKNKDK